MQSGPILVEACCQVLERNAASGGSGGGEDNLLTLAQNKRIALVSNARQAMRSAFTYSKDVKELLRGGLENGDFIRNYDMKQLPNRLLGEAPLTALGRQMG